MEPWYKMVIPREEVREGRSFIKTKALGLGMTLLCGALMLVSFALIVLGGQIETWIEKFTGTGPVLLALFAVFQITAAVFARIATGANRVR